MNGTLQVRITCPTHPIPEIESLTAGYAALNRDEIPGFLAVIDPQVERFEPPGWPEGERFLGIAAFAEHTKRARGTWAGCCRVGFSPPSA